MITKEYEANTQVILVFRGSIKASPTYSSILKVIVHLQVLSKIQILPTSNLYGTGLHYTTTIVLLAPFLFRPDIKQPTLDNSNTGLGWYSVPHCIWNKDSFCWYHHQYVWFSTLGHKKDWTLKSTHLNAKPYQTTVFHPKVQNATFVKWYFRQKIFLSEQVHLELKCQEHLRMK